MDLFDWKFYLDEYPDLRINGVHTEKQAIDHWNTHGKVEGRICYNIPCNNIPHFYPDYFTPLAKYNFENILPEIVNFQKDINYLEIGTFQGASTHFMFTRLLNLNSTVTIIDPFENSQSEAIGNYNLFKNNLKDYLPRIKEYKEYSNNILNTLPKDSFDVVYIDGSHLAKDVYYDLTHTFDLVKKGGIIICDDYLWFLLKNICGTHTDCLPFDDSQPIKAINQFIKEKKLNNEIEYVTTPVLLDEDEGNSKFILTVDKITNLFGDVNQLTKNSIHKINYQFIFKKL